MRMRFAALGFACALLSGAAAAQGTFQGPATIQGATTANDCMKVLTTGSNIIVDSGGTCGGGGTPGGSAGQIQWNSASAFGGFTASGDATINTSTGVVTVTQLDGQLALSYGASLGLTATFASNMPLVASTSTYGIDFVCAQAAGSAITQPINACLQSNATITGNLSNYGNPTAGDFLAAYVTVTVNGASGTLAAAKGIESNVNTNGAAAWTLTDSRPFYSNLNFADAAATVTGMTVYGFGMTAQAGTLSSLVAHACPSLTGSFTIAAYHCVNNLDANADIVNAGPFKQANVLRLQGTGALNVPNGEIVLTATAAQPTFTTSGGSIRLDAVNGPTVSGLGSTNDGCWRNSAGAAVFCIPTGTQNITASGAIVATVFKPNGALSGTSVYQPAANQVGISTNNTKKFVWDTNGNISAYGTAPAVSACGTSAVTANSTNTMGQVNITAGTPATCTITFANSGYTTWNFCVVNDESSLTAPGFSYSLTVLTISATALSGKVDWECMGI